MAEEHNKPLFLKERVMKGVYLLKLEEAINAQPNPFGLGEELHFTGSSVPYLMRRHGHIRDVIPKVPGDVDIGVYMEDPEKLYPNAVLRKMLDIVKDAAESIGMRAENIESQPLSTHDSVYQFRLIKTVDAQEVRATIGQRPDIPFIGSSQDVDVELAVQVMPYNRALLKTTTWHAPYVPGDNQLTIRYADPRDSFATKLVRSMAPERANPNDLADMYNMVNSTPPLVSLDLDRDLLRVISVVTMACMGATEEALDVERYTRTPEHIEELKQTVTIYGHNTKINDVLAIKLLDNADAVTRELFPRGEDGHILLPQEREFIEAVLNPVHPLVTDNIRVELLEQAYPDVFAENPELARNIRNSTFVIDKAQEKGLSTDIGLG